MRGAQDRGARMTPFANAAVARAIVFNATDRVPVDSLALCIAAALTCRRAKVLARAR